MDQILKNDINGNTKGKLRDNVHDVFVALKEQKIPCMASPHLHTEYEIYYNISGGKGFFVGEQYYDCSSGDMFIIKKMAVHRVTVSEPENYVRCVISVDCTIIEKIRNLLENKAELDFLDQAGDSLPIKVHLDLIEHEKYLMHIREYLRLEQGSNSLLLMSKLFEILAFIRNLYYSRKDTRISEAQPETWSEKAIQFIEKHYSRCQTSDVANALGINEYYLARLFKNEVGVSINNYIIQRRIAQAKILLYNGECVKDTCQQLGFNDCSNFIRTFKKFAGVSPGSIKKKGHEK